MHALRACVMRPATAAAAAAAAARLQARRLSAPSRPGTAGEVRVPREKRTPYKDAGSKGDDEDDGKKKVGFVYLLLPMGVLMYYVVDDLRTVYDRATAPFDVLDVAADVSIQISKYGCAPMFVRLAWRTFCNYDQEQKDGECMAGSLVDANSIVAKLPANRGLDRAIELLRPVKERHPEVSWPDLIALAGCVAIEDLGGPRISFRCGRPESGPTDLELPKLLARTPDHTKSVGHLKNIFYRLGFGRGELVALMGAHGLGAVHKQFTGVDCVRSTTPYVFDNSYFLDLLDSDWAPETTRSGTVYTGTAGLSMHPIDVALLKDPELRRYVVAYSMDERQFHDAFGAAFQRLLEMGYADAGLKRTVWRGINSSEI